MADLRAGADIIDRLFKMSGKVFFSVSVSFVDLLFPGQRHRVELNSVYAREYLEVFKLSL